MKGTYLTIFIINHDSQFPWETGNSQTFEAFKVKLEDSGRYSLVKAIF